MDWFVLAGIVGFCLSIAVIVRFFQGVSRLREISDKLDRLVPPPHPEVAHPEVPNPEVANPEVPDPAAGLQAMPGPATTRPGWYPDPENDELERRWTGSSWALDEPRPAKRQRTE